MADLDTEPKYARQFLRSILLGILREVPNITLKRSVSDLTANRDTLVTLFGGTEGTTERDVTGRSRGAEGNQQEFEVLGFLASESDTSDGIIPLVAAEQDRFLDDVRGALVSYEGGEQFRGPGYWIETGPIEFRRFSAVVDDEGSTAYAGVEGVLTYTQLWGV